MQTGYAAITAPAPVTIGNITDAYNKAAHGNGFNEEFVYSKTELQLIDKYDLTGDLHTDLHECLDMVWRAVAGATPMLWKLAVSPLKKLMLTCSAFITWPTL